MYSPKKDKSTTTKKHYDISNNKIQSIHHRKTEHGYKKQQHDDISTEMMSSSGKMTDTNAEIKY